MNTSPDSKDDKAQRIRRIRWAWTIANFALAIAAVWSLTSDVWEAFITAFLASALLQLLWMRRNLY